MEPTVGRILYYYPHPSDEILAHNMDGQPLAAIVAHVNECGTVNLGVFDANGNGTVARTSVPLFQPDEPIEPNIEYATWMPYQVQVAKEQEAKTPAPVTPAIPKPATTVAPAAPAAPAASK